MISEDTTDNVVIAQPSIRLLEELILILNLGELRFYFVSFVITIGTRCQDSPAWR